MAQHAVGLDMSGAQGPPSLVDFIDDLNAIDSTISNILWKPYTILHTAVSRCRDLLVLVDRTYIEFAAPSPPFVSLIGGRGRQIALYLGSKDALPGSALICAGLRRRCKRLWRWRWAVRGSCHAAPCDRP